MSEHVHAVYTKVTLKYKKMTKHHGPDLLFYQIYIAADLRWQIDFKWWSEHIFPQSPSAPIAWTGPVHAFRFVWQCCAKCSTQQSFCILWSDRIAPPLRSKQQKRIFSSPKVRSITPFILTCAWLYLASASVRGFSTGVRIQGWRG